MPRTISYAEALKILGVRSASATGPASRLLGGVIIGATAATLNLNLLGLLDARTELLDQARRLIGHVGAAVRGARGRNRTDLMVAAHTVIVVNAFFRAFEAFDEATSAAASFTLSDQLRLAGTVSPGSNQIVEALLAITPMLPSPSKPFEDFIPELHRYYQGLGYSVAEELTALAVWDRLSETQRDRITQAASTTLPQDALDIYEADLRRLCVDCPEFSYWVWIGSAAATRHVVRDASARVVSETSNRFDELARIVTEVSASLENLAASADHADWPGRVVRSNEAQMDRGIAEIGALDDLRGLAVPDLRHGYVVPACRVTPITPADSPASDAWWQRHPRRDDCYRLLRAELTTPQAFEAPLVILGRPGSGKSLLMRMTAATLPANDFLPVLVELRSVPADIDLQSQIEYAMRLATGVPMDWVSLVEATPATPVLLLDGLDELLQASGGRRSEFLEKVAEFQHRETELGRPVAAVVTSRTVVADQVRYPEGVTALRLEPFDTTRIETWLNGWNDLNAAYFQRTGLKPLSSKDLTAHRDLAKEPLLLLMLALYDATENALPRHSESFKSTDLYERLLQQFVSREVRRRPESSPLSPAEADQLVALEMERLAVAAFAMINRDRLYATEAEIHADLGAIGGNRLQGHAEGRLLPGRFFFIHQSQISLRDAGQYRSYEFLHATFGEYLIARQVGMLLMKPGEAPGSWALLSFAPLSDRQQIVVFLRELLSTRQLDSPDRRPAATTEVRDALSRPFELLSQAYRPKVADEGRRSASVLANAVLIAVCIEDTVTASELLATRRNGDGWSALREWRFLALTWRASMSSSSWDAFTGLLDIEHFDSEGPDLRIRLRMGVSNRRAVVDMRLAGTAAFGPAAGSPSAGQRNISLHREGILCDPDTDLLLHTVEPLVEQFPEASLTFTVGADDMRRSIMHQLMELLLSGPRMGLGGARSSTYGDVVQVAQQLAAAERSRMFDLLAHQLQFDRATMSQQEFLAIADKLLLCADLPGTAITSLALQVIQTIPEGDDPQASVAVLARLAGRLDMDDTAPLKIYFALLDVGIDPACLGDRWRSPFLLARQVGLTRIGQSDPRTAARLIMKAVTDGSAAEQLDELSELLPACSGGSLLLLPADVFRQLLARLNEHSQSRVLSRWTSVRGPLPDDPGST